ncbi:A disintegrin and metalloproteinase with thrombospondin motifs like [Amblyomma americanum]
MERSSQQLLSQGMKGLVGPSYRIEPLLSMKRSDSGLVPHMIYEIEQKPVIDRAIGFDDNENCPDSWETKPPKRRRGRKPRKPEPGEFVAEVFFLLDHPHFRHFKNKEDALMYICIMMNSANLRFTDVANPRVRLMVTGVEEPSGEEYVRGTEELLADSDTLPELKKYAGRKKDEFGNPDIVYLLSGRDVISKKGDEWDKNARGVGYVSGVCTDHYVALGEDLPGLYTGMITMTHELGHVLGAVHDGDGPYRYIRGHPGAKSCPWDDGFVMSYVNKGANHQIFSRCSLRQMAYVLRQHASESSRRLVSG